MRYRHPSPQVVACCLALLLARSSLADDVSREKRTPLTPGAPFPELELRDLEGSPWSRARFKEKKAVVVVCIGVDCPMSRQYASRLALLARDFSARGVAWLALSSCRQDDVQELRAFAREFALEIPILKDHGARLADLLGAERVTESFLFDGDLKLRYRGRIDDQFALTDRSVGLRKDHAEVNYLTDALEAVLAGKEVALATTTPAGCVIGREARDPAVASPQKPTPSFHEHVEPILQRRCQSCHRPGQIGPFSLLSYDDAVGWDGMIAEVVAQNRMPPWHADPAHGQFANDRSLTPAEKATLVAWAEGGALRGDPATAPPPVSFPSSQWQMGEPDVVFAMPRSFTVPAHGKVKYQHFTVETGFEQDKWVQAIEVRAGDRTVVHHILVFAVDPENPQGWRKETAGGTQGYFAAMVPGEEPTVFPAGMAKKVPARATLVFQIHYTTNGKITEDRSRIGFIFAKEKVERKVRTRTAVNLAIRIPAATAEHVERAQHQFKKPVKILSLLPHMHLRGWAFRYDYLLPARAKVSKNPWDADLPMPLVQRIRYEPTEQVMTWLGSMDDEQHQLLAAYFTTDADRAALDSLRREARSETWLSIPAYDFGWQTSYRFAEPKEVVVGAVLEVTAVFNNSATNSALTRDQWEKPVRWGNQTWEEMLIGYFDEVEG